MKEKFKKSPWILRQIIGFLTDFREKYAIMGDLEEIFQEIQLDKGYAAACCWYLYQSFVAVVRYTRYVVSGGIGMIKYYLKIAIRNIFLHKGYSFINVAGLAIGIACSVLLLLYIQFELSYDRYHEDSDRIYRVAREYNSTQYASTPGVLSPAIKQNYPEIEESARIKRAQFIVNHGNDYFFGHNVIYADSNIFNIFDIPLIDGNPSEILDEPYTIVITRHIADKYFKNQSPIGNLLRMNGKDHTVTGIIENPPGNTHLLKYGILVSMKSIINEGNKDLISKWETGRFYTYLKLKKHMDPKKIQEKIAHIANMNFGSGVKKSGSTITFFLQKLTNIHLCSHLRHELEANGNPVHIYIFSGICALILIIGCINFINLTTSRIAKRAKEIGMRKIVGASRAQISMQFLGDSFIIALIAMISAFLIVALSLPYFCKITGLEFSFIHLFQPFMILSFICILLFVGFVAGCYPALFLSRLKPLRILNVKKELGSGKSIVRKILVVGQFTISITLIICLLFFYKQLNYMQNMDLGFKKDQKLIIPMREQESDRAYLEINLETLKNDFSNQSSIMGVTFLSLIPARQSHYWQMVFERDSHSCMSQVLPIDIDFTKEYNIKILAGRTFSRNMRTDGTRAVIINRTAAREFGFANPADAINQKIVSKYNSHEDIENELTIIGISEDFNYYSIRSQIKPAVMVLNSEYFRFMSITLSPESMTESLRLVEKKWKEFFPGRPFVYFFLDDYINSQFRTEKQIRTIITIFTGLGIFIACLGLYGLVAFKAEQRTKEIGIRKVLGSSVIGAVGLLIKEFIGWILLANIFSSFISYFVVKNWIRDFAYRINISPTIFLVSAIFIMTLAILTVGFRVIKSAQKNPVETLRHE